MILFIKYYNNNYPRKMASRMSSSVDRKVDIDNLLACIKPCLEKLKNNKFWFVGSTPFFATFNREEEQAYSALMEAVRLIPLVWKENISYSWVEKTVFDEAGRNTGRTRLCFELKSELN